MRESARGVAAAALLLGLLTLQAVAPGGLPALLGAAACLLLARASPRRGRRRRRAGALAGLRALAEVLPAVIAGSVAAGTLLHVALAPDPPVAVAWFARTLSLGAAALLARTPTPALPLHGLAVLLALWTAAALAPPGAPPPALLALVLLALTALGAALQLARTLELREAAAASVTVGVARRPGACGRAACRPRPWPSWRRSPWPWASSSPA